MSVLVFEHSNSCRLDRFGAVLSKYGHPLRVIRLHQGDTCPTDLDGCHAIVSLGGSQSANTLTPQIQSEMELIRQAHQFQLPVIGLCLGAQVIAKALGGEVTPMQGGIDLGFIPVSLTPVGREEPVFSGIPWEHRQFSWHRDEVSKLPPGARILASSKRCKVEAWGLGLRTYGFQFHPEVFAETIHRWVREEPDDLREAGSSSQTLQDQVNREYPDFERLSLRLFESLALFVMPLDRRYKGIVKDLHH